MEFKAVKPIAVLAVLIDADARKSEVIDVDTLQMRAMAIDHDAKSLRLRFRWGGYASNGRFYVAQDLGGSERTIQANVDGEREIWEACACDEFGNAVLDHGAAFVEKILIEHGKVADIVNGGWQLNVELEYDGVSVGATTDNQGAFKAISPQAFQKARAAIQESGVVNSSLDKTSD